MACKIRVRHEGTCWSEGCTRAGRVPMTPATFPHDRADAPIFADGLGERVLAADATTGELLQVLRLRAELTGVPSFEFALRERTARLMNFRHAYYARVRRVDRLPGGGGLAIIS